MDPLRCIVCAALLPVALAGQSPTLTATAGHKFALAVEHLNVAARATAAVDEGCDVRDGLNLAVASGQAHGSLSFQVTAGRITTFESMPGRSARSKAMPPQRPAASVASASAGSV